MRKVVGPSPRLGAYVTMLPPHLPDPAAFTREWSRILDAGAQELHLYHAGLASASRLDAVGVALAELRR